MEMSKETKLRKLKKWQELNSGLEYDLRGESSIKSINGNNETWVQKGSKGVEKNTLKKHLECVSNKKAADCEKRKNLGIEKYIEKVINETPIGKGLKWTGTDDKKALEIKFNSAYYLAKNE